MATLETRREQIFPKFSLEEIDRLRRFGEERRYNADTPLFVTGEISPGMFVIINGTVEVDRHDSLGSLAPIVEMGPGEFVAEIGQLAGGPALVDARAKTEVEALLIPPRSLRGVLITEPEIGDQIMRALILRRVVLIETGAGGPVLIGPRASGDMVRLQGFLTRNAYPFQVLDPAEDQDAASLVEQYVQKPQDLPLAVCPKGTILKNPSEADLAKALDMIPADVGRRSYDVAIVGAGPAGLSTAVYAASEGLSVIVLDAKAFGGQAGASARIENYFGFPTGIAGQTLTARGYVQAEKFGAVMAIPVCVKCLDCASSPIQLELSDGGQVKARTVVIASGASYRRPDIPHLRDFEGRGVWYWASPIEARMCKKEEVVIIGGGNSAGQAAVYLRRFAARIYMLVRGKSLSDSMSRYLIDRIEATENITVLTETELVALSGSPKGQLDRVRWRNRATGEETEKDIHNVFVMIGADPATGWLEGCGVALDEKRFVQTGSDRPNANIKADGAVALPMPLESSLRGVFAVGDVRSGSVKRVGAAIGEGAAVVAELHAVLEAAHASS